MYLVCAVSLVFVMTVLMGGAYWFFSVFIVLLFGYLAYNRANSPAPFFYGPHECMDCGKVIYGETCPYCEEKEWPAGGPNAAASKAVRVSRDSVDSSPSHMARI